MADAQEQPGDDAAREQYVEGGNADDSLEGAARDGMDYARERLRAELGREPSEDETNEWLREQTEGY